MPLDVEKAATFADSSEVTGAPEQEIPNRAARLPSLECFSAAIYRLWEQESDALEHCSWDQLDESEKEHFRVISERILSLKREFDEALQENYAMNSIGKTN